MVDTSDTEQSDSDTDSTNDTGLGADPSGLAGPTGSPHRSIAKDDAFHLLQNARRRAVVRYLLAHPDQARVQVRTLSEAVAAWEHDTTVGELTSDQRQRVYIALYQSHLPTLDDNGVVRYDQDRGVVEPTPLLAVFVPFVEDGLDGDSQALSVDGTVGDAAGVSRAIARLVVSVRPG